MLKFMDKLVNKKISTLILLKDKLRRLLYKMEIDRTVFFGVLTKIWGVITAPLTMLLIILKFTPEYQGYYYAFNSLLVLQVFVELGLGTVILQFASHEWVKLKLDNNGGITGDKEALSRLMSLADITIKWFLVGGVIVAFGLGIGGHLFFLQSQINSNVNWALPWFFLCILTGINVCFIPVWSLLEGCNQVSAVYTFRFFQGIIASLSIWIAMFLGVKLWSVGISLAATVLCAILFFKYKYYNFIKSLLFTKLSGPRMDWRSEIFPMQWRIALSWISGYFVFSLFTPVIFHYHGSIIAGQFGMTWSVVGVVSLIAGSWLPPKVPKFGMLIAERKYKELDDLFWRVTKIFSSIAVLVTIVVWCSIYLLNRLNHPFASRLLPLLPTTLFLVAQVLVILSLPFSVYLRAHKREPLLFLSVSSGVLVALSTLVLGKYCSVTAMAIGYLSINSILIPIVIIVWYRCRIEWHKDKYVDVVSLEKGITVNKVF